MGGAITKARRDERSLCVVAVTIPPARSFSHRASCVHASGGSFDRADMQSAELIEEGKKKKKEGDIDATSVH